MGGSNGNKANLSPAEAGAGLSLAKSEGQFDPLPPPSAERVKTHLFSFNFWVGVLKIKSTLEKPSDKCEKTHIIRNSFQGA